jgi:hypothetical protein
VVLPNFQIVVLGDVSTVDAYSEVITFSERLNLHNTKRQYYFLLLYILEPCAVGFGDFAKGTHMDTIAFLDKVI